MWVLNPTFHHSTHSSQVHPVSPSAPGLMKRIRSKRVLHAKFAPTLLFCVVSLQLPWLFRAPNLVYPQKNMYLI